MIITILIFFAVLLALVIVHEWGHFYAAKKTGMEVEEFGFGFPPRMFSVKKGGTRYSFNWFPLGGFVKIKGENGDDTGPGSFSSKSKRSRLLVLSAGVIMNMVLAWVLLSLALGIGTPQALSDKNGSANSSDHRVIISAVAPSSPAANAGIQGGDVILEINGEQISEVQDVQKFTRENTEREITVVADREGQRLEFKLTPRANPPTGEGATGVQLVEVADVSYPWYEAAWRGLALTWDYTKLTVMGFGQIIGQLFTEEKIQGEVTGPIGIAVLTGKFAKMGIAPLFQFAAILSINLAIINALPIPALDGGRIAFLGYEAIRRKKPHVKIEQWAHAVGFVLLLLLMLIVTVRDVGRLFN